MTIESSFEVVGVGQCCLDLLGTVVAYPLPDTKCEVANMVTQGGGPIATALVALSRWGVRCSFSGVVGDDAFGRTIAASLTDEGIDISGLMVRPGSASQFAFIVAEPRTARRTIFWRRPTGPPLQASELNLDRIRAARVVHTDGLFMEASLAACRTAQEAGVSVMVDAGSMRPGMLDLASASDCFLASEVFSRALVGEKGPHAACEHLAKLGPRVVGVTLGARGYVVLAEGQFIERPAYPVTALDTTGCGDVFHAGVILGLLKDWDIETGLDFAAWAAARVSLQLGGRAGIPPLDEYPSLHM